MDDRHSQGRAREASDLPVSVVIPAYNCEAYIREAVDSVLAQTFTDFELIVVNDASTDGTADILGTYERAGSARVVTHERNCGLSAARNSGIRHARGTYVTFLDADDVWRPEKLAYQMSILEDDPGIALLGNAEMNFWDGDDFTFPPLPAKSDLRPLQWERLLMGVCGLSPSNAIMRRDCFEKVGGFDEDLRAAEDRDQWLRIVRRFRGAVDSAVVNAYRLRPESMSTDPARMKENEKRVLEKAFKSVRSPLALRARAYAHAYLDIAITCYEAGRRFGALEHLVKSCLVWPLPLGRDFRRTPMVRLVWAVKILLGRSTFERLWGVAKRDLRARTEPSRVEAGVAADGRDPSEGAR